ncbi:MAG: hypothetical protein H0U27_03855, partial [Nitrosopumilus sp.]|nr:hypothetical protein [Nitrosopumilus sp.]
MAIIAELCGIPGAGKSTIYHTLKSIWKSHYPWIPFHKALPKTDIDSNSVKQLFITLAKKTLNLPNVNEMEEAGKRFISTHPEYINFFWKA